MALIEISNSDNFISLAKKYKFKSVDEMLNTIYNEIEWVLEADIKYQRDYTENEVINNEKE